MSNSKWQSLWERSLFNTNNHSKLAEVVQTRGFCGILTFYNVRRRSAFLPIFYYVDERGVSCPQVRSRRKRLTRGCDLLQVYGMTPSTIGALCLCFFEANTTVGPQKLLCVLRKRLERGCDVLNVCCLEHDGSVLLCFFTFVRDGFRAVPRIVHGRCSLSLGRMVSPQCYSLTSLVVCSRHLPIISNPVADGTTLVLVWCRQSARLNGISYMQGYYRGIVVSIVCLSPWHRLMLGYHRGKSLKTFVSVIIGNLSRFANFFFLARRNIFVAG